jgi:hypothetical protein
MGLCTLPCSRGGKHGHSEGYMHVKLMLDLLLAVVRSLNLSERMPEDTEMKCVWIVLG